MVNTCVCVIQVCGQHMCVCVIQVLKSVWAFLFDNLAVALSFLYTFIQLLLSGGTVLINSVCLIVTWGGGGEKGCMGR